jgi:hypothetical protein
MSEQKNHYEPGTKISFEVTFDDGVKESNVIEINKWDLTLEEATTLFRRMLLAVGYIESQVNEYFAL